MTRRDGRVNSALGKDRSHKAGLGIGTALKYTNQCTHIISAPFAWTIGQDASVDMHDEELARGLTERGYM